MYDSDDKVIFPTRHGETTGSANERVMLDKVDVTSFRTQYRDNPDGSVTRLRTRGGMPEFVTTAKKQESDPVTPVTPPVTRVLVGERIYDRTGQTAEAYTVTVDFKTMTVSQTLIPMTKYIGGDGTTDWKKYRRHCHWESADGKRRLDYRNYVGHPLSHGMRINTGSYEPAYYEDDNTVPPTRKFLNVGADDIRGYVAVKDIVFAGNPYTVVVTYNGYWNVANGRLMALDGMPFTPFLVGGNAWISPLCNQFTLFNRTGSKQAAVAAYRYDENDSNTNKRHSSYPGWWVRDEATLVVTGGPYTRESESQVSCVGTNLGPLWGNPFDSWGAPFSAQMEATYTYEYPLSAHFDGDALTQVTLRTVASGSGNKWSSDSASGETFTANVNTAVLVGGVEALSFASRYSLIGHTSGNSVMQSGHRIASLSYPEEKVHLLIFQEASYTDQSPGGIVGCRTTVKTNSVLIDSTHGKTYEFTSPSFITAGYYFQWLGAYADTGGDQMTTGGKEMSYIPNPAWLTKNDTQISGNEYYTSSVSRYAAQLPSNPLDDYGPEAILTYGITSIAEWKNESHAMYADSVNNVEKMVIGGIYADKDIIVFSFQTPGIWLASTGGIGEPLVIDTTRQDRINVAIERATGKQITFDNGCGFQLIYKALDTLP